MMTDTPELQISSIKAAFDKEKSGQDPYIWFRLGKQEVTTPVIKEGGADGQPVSWSEPLSLQADGLEDKDGSQLQVRAYDKKPLLPDSLLGRATVDLASLGGLGNSQVAGSGGGAEVNVQLLGKSGAFGGHVSFTLTATEGLTIPGGTEWGPQEPHHSHPSATSGERELGVGTAGYTGLGATAYPARDSGKDLHGEHLSDFRGGQAGDKASSRTIAAGAAAAATSAATLGAVAADGGHPVVSGTGGAGYPPSAAAAGSGTAGTAAATTAGQGSESTGPAATAGFGGGGATAFPAQASGKDLGGERLSDFDKQQQQGSGPAATAGIGGGGATAFPAEASGKGLGGERLSDFDQQEQGAGPAATAGFGGGGATAFPAQASGKDLGGEHLSDFDKQQQQQQQGSGPAATAGFGGGGATAFPAEASGKGLGGERLSDFDQQEQGAGPAATAGFGGGGATAFPAEASGKGFGGERLSDFDGQQRQDSGPAATAGFGGGGATAFPAKASGKDLGGEHLSDFEKQGRTGAGAGATTGGGAAAAGSGSCENAGPLHISGIGGKLVREDDTLGHVTPYLVFEIGDEREHTGTLGAIKAMEPLNWDDTLTIDLPSASTDDTLKVTAYDKKMLLLPDSYLGEVSAPLSQLPRGSPVTLKLQSAKMMGSFTGEVSFTLQAGGNGAKTGDGGGQGVEGLSVADRKQGVTS